MLQAFKPLNLESENSTIVVMWGRHQIIQVTICCITEIYLVDVKQCISGAFYLVSEIWDICVSESAHVAVR